MTQLTGRGPQTLLPSLEAAYPWLLALGATCLYAGIGLARRRLGERVVRRRRFLAGGTLGLLLLLMTGSAFSAAAIVNELAVSNRLVERLAVRADRGRHGAADLHGPGRRRRDGAAPAPVGRLDRRPVRGPDGHRRDPRRRRRLVDRLRRDARGARHVRRRRGWARRRGGWRRARTGAASAVADATGRDLDRQLVAVALTPSEANAPEDRGLAYIEGALARHCRVTLVGSTLRRALPEIQLLVGDADIDRWRGELDFWVFADGQLGQADGRITGSAVGLAQDSLTAALRFRLLAYDRGLPVAVLPPVR